MDEGCLLFLVVVTAALVVAFLAAGAIFVLGVTGVI